METFGARLKAAMLAAGLDPTPENLARASGLSVQRAKRWLSLQYPPRSVIHAARTSHELGVRMYWLATGEGRVGRGAKANGLERKLLVILEALSPEDAARMLAEGEKLIS